MADIDWDYINSLAQQANGMSAAQRYDFAKNQSGQAIQSDYDPNGWHQELANPGTGSYETNIVQNYNPYGATTGLQNLGYTGAVNTGNTGQTGLSQSPFGYQTMYGQALNGSLPTQQVQGAPVYSSAGLRDGNVSAMDPALWTTLNAGNRGGFSQGVGAFLGGAWQPYERNDQNEVVKDNTRQLYDLANATGFQLDPHKYQYSDQQSSMRLYNDMNDYLKNYYGIAGLSSGWSGNSNPLAASRTLYMDNGQGQIIPVSGHQDYRAQTSSEFNRANNGEMATALSMVLPIFGGAAGILGAGAEGTLSAGAGLGLTNGAAGAIGTGATNALVNAGTNYALSGGRASPLQSILGSVVGAGGNSLMGNANGLGSLFDTSGAANLGSTYNSMTGLNQMLGTTGLGNNLGGIAGLFGSLGGGGINAQNMSQLGGSLAGQYLAMQLDPRLRGLGGQAGSNLASLFYR